MQFRYDIPAMLMFSIHTQDIHNTFKVIIKRREASHSTATGLLINYNIISSGPFFKPHCVCCQIKSQCHKGRISVNMYTGLTQRDNTQLTVSVTTEGSHPIGRL